MEYRYPGNSGLRVSVLSMGTISFGGRGGFDVAGNQGVPKARQLVDLHIDAGINRLC